MKPALVQPAFLFLCFLLLRCISQCYTASYVLQHIRVTPDVGNYVIQVRFPLNWFYKKTNQKKKSSLLLC